MIIKKIINSHSKTLIKKILGFFLLINPKFYWKYIDFEKKKSHFDNIIQDQHLEEMFNKMERVSSIFEFGCGFGDRLYNLSKNNPTIHEIHGYDINKNRIEKGNLMIKKQKIKNVKLFNSLNNINKKYDLVFTSMTLIYFKEKDILNILNKLIKRSNRYIILQEVLSESNFVHKSTLFAYNYSIILKEFGINNFKINKIDNPNWVRDKKVYGANIFIDLNNL